MPLDQSERKRALVDRCNGPYRSLEEALDEVEPFTTIYLAEGVYSCHKPITKPGIIICKRDIEKDVFIVGNEGPVIEVQLEKADYVVFKDIVITHSGLCF